MNNLAQSEVFSLTLVIGTYMAALALYKKTRISLLHPLLTSILVIIAVLKMMGIEYESFQRGSHLIHFLLGPSVVALGFVLYEQMQYLKGNVISILTSVFVGAIIGIVSVIVIGDLMGAAVAYAGFSTLNGASIAEKILLPLILSPLAGFGMGFLTMFLIMLLCARANRNKLTRAFTKLQIVSAAFMATSHGLNDAQKTMGVITLALFIFNKIDTIAVPFWVKCVCALAMAMGTALGGWKIIKTMGHKIFKLEPVHGFATETSAAAVICGASLFGAPVSTTHTITACIFGVGSTKRLSAVRWGVAGNLVIAWILTIPASAFIAAIAFWCMKIGGIV